MLHKSNKKEKILDKTIRAGDNNKNASYQIQMLLIKSFRKFITIFTSYCLIANFLLGH